jgi:hypothetical protein
LRGRSLEHSRRSDQELLNTRFLKALKKTCKTWENDKEFSKIVKKMEKGKNLKKKEFARVYCILWERNQYH